jgi:hypothetical protein
MVNYLYKVEVYKTGEKVGNIAQSVIDLICSNFETNYKSSTIEVSEVEIIDTTFIIELFYDDFKSKVTGDITWADVKYIDAGKKYKLYLLSESPI